jgi:hypothetical protein
LIYVDWLCRLFSANCSAIGPAMTMISSRPLVATHEAAHAIVALALGYQLTATIEDMRDLT